MISVETLEHVIPLGAECSESLFEKPKKDRSEELPQVETASGQDGVDFVAFCAFEIIAVHPVI